jgi:hypothetical protein
LILSKASPQTHFTEFFSVAFFPISPRCLLQTSTTSGSNSNQSTKLKSLEIHSLATPPSPPPIIAALSLFLFKLRPAPTKVELYKCSSVEATCISPSINNDFPNCSNSKISMCWPTFDLKSSRTSLTT